MTWRFDVTSTRLGPSSSPSPNMLRPWRHHSSVSQSWAAVNLAEDGEGLFRLGDVAWRRHTASTPFAGCMPVVNLTQVQRHKGLNLYVQLAGEEGADGEVHCHDHVRLEHVLHAFAHVHLKYAGLSSDAGEEHAMERAARSWWSHFTAFNSFGSAEDRAACIIRREHWLPTCAALLSALPTGELPKWMVDVHVEQFKLVATYGADADWQLQREEFIRWRTAVQRFTPQQVERVTKMAAWCDAIPTLGDVFDAADATRSAGKKLSCSAWPQFIERWWTSSEPHCETVMYSL